MKAFIFIVSVLTIISCRTFAQFGQGWVEQNTGTTQTLTSAHSNETVQNYVWACGYGGTVLRSTNNGQVWQNVGSNGIPSNMQLINIVCIDANTALTAGYVGSNTFVFRTSNAGANWTQVFTEAGFINAICFRNDQGIMQGDPVGGRWSLWRSTDNGITWDSSGLYLPQAGGEAGWNNAMWNIGQQVWFGTNNTRLYYSTNFGASWTSQATTGNINSYAVWFHTLGGGQDGLVGGTALLRSTNFGNIWSTVTSMGAGNFGGITGGPNVLTESLIYTFYVRSSAVIYASTNDGTNWFAQYTTPTGTFRYIGTNMHGTKFWAVQTDGGISYIDIPISGITQISSEVPEAFSLSQNFPNPFNPETKISYSVKTSGNVLLQVYDARGKEVTTLVSEHQSSGTYAVEWNASDFPSGVYYYKFSIFNFGDNEAYSDVKKMVLVK